MKNVFVISTIVRLTLITWITLNNFPNGDESLSQYIKSAGLRSVLSNPTHTLDHMREGFFLSKVTPNGSLVIINDNDNDNPTDFVNGSNSQTYAHIYMEGPQSKQNNRSAFFHAPPLLLALVDPVLLTWIPSPVIQDLVFALLMMLVDLFTAVRLFQLATNLLSAESSSCTDSDVGEAGDSDTDTDTMIEWEINLEQKMDPLIQPNFAWVFGLFFPNDIGDDVVADTKSPASSDVVSKKEAIVELSDIPKLCAIFYYCNPISILANGGGACSFHGLWHLLLVSTLQELTATKSETTHSGNCKVSQWSTSTRQPSKNNVPLAMLYFAMIFHVEINHIVFLLPMILITNRQLGYDRLVHSSVGCIGFFLLWTLLLQYLSLLLVGSENFFAMLRQSHAKELNFVDLEPNIGMQWYFFISMFDRFRRYFVVMHFGLPFIFVCPLMIRFHRYPFDIISIMNLILSLFKPTPTLNDMIITLCFLLMSPRTLARTTHKSLVSLAALPVPIILYVMDYWLWLETGSGNANYIYFQCLAYNTFCAIILMDFLTALMRREKALRLTEKGPRKRKVEKGEDDILLQRGSRDLD